MANMTLEERNTILKAMGYESEAALAQNASTPPFELRKLTVDLSSARSREAAKEIIIPFRTLYVGGSTSFSSTVYIIPNSLDIGQEGIPMSRKDILSFPTQQAKCFLYNDAQSGQSVDLYFLVSGELKTGTQNVNIASSVDGSSFDQATPVSVTNTATLIDNSSRNVLNLYNDGSVTVFLGNSGVTAANGFPLIPGEKTAIKNTAAVYGITLAGSSSIRINKEA